MLIDLPNCTGSPGNGLECDSAIPLWPKGYGCRGYRLPTEAEWEYAARAGTTTAWYSGGNGVDGETCLPNTYLNDLGWFCSNSGGTTHPIGLADANDYGLFDLYGNVREWCWDFFSTTYFESSPGVDPLGPDSGDCRVRRGGSFSESARYLRSASRYCYPGGKALQNLGFRVVRTK